MFQKGWDFDVRWGDGGFWAGFVHFVGLILSVDERVSNTGRWRWQWNYGLHDVFVCVAAPCCFCMLPTPCCFYMCTSSLLFLYVYQLPVVFICVPAPCCASLILHFVLDSLLLNTSAPLTPPHLYHHGNLHYCGTLKQGGRWFIRKVWPLG